MRYLFLLSVTLLMMTLNCLGQNASSTPVPVSAAQDSTIEKKQNQRSENPVRLSKPLLKINNGDQQTIIYLAASKDGENTKYQLKMYYREKTFKELVVENVNQPAMLLVDGNQFASSNENFDASLNKNQPYDSFSINTFTFTFDIPEQEVKGLSLARSISIIWRQSRFDIAADGLNVLQSFIRN